MRLYYHAERGRLFVFDAHTRAPLASVAVPGEFPLAELGRHLERVRRQLEVTEAIAAAQLAVAPIPAAVERTGATAFDCGSPLRRQRSEGGAHA